MKHLIRYCMLLIPGVAAGQPAEGGGWVRVAAPPPGTVVVVDGRVLGPASVVHALPAGPVTLALVEGDARAWNPRRVEITTAVPVGDTLTLDLRLPTRYRVSTLPSGAAVTLERPDGSVEALGVSPLVLDRAEPLRGTLVAARDGYREARAAPGDSAVNHVALTLAPLTEEEGAAVDWRPPGRARTWIDVAAGAVALSAAAVAIHYKLQADAVDDRYRSPESPERGDPGLRVEAQRLDRISAGALGVMQLGLGVLAIRLVLR